MLEIMERYSWDYNQYMNQPTWVVDLARKKIGMEAKIAKHAATKINNNG